MSHEANTGGSVERRITESNLAEGIVPLGPGEAARLGLPSHSCEMNGTALGRRLSVVWDPARRQLHGDSISEFLIDEMQVGELLRIHREGDGLTFEPVAPVIWDDDRTGGGHTDGKNPPTRRRRRRRRGDPGRRFRLRTDSDYAWEREVGVLSESVDALLRSVEERAWVDSETYRLRVRGEELGAISGFDELLAAHLAKVDHMPHQSNAALKVLSQMRGRAVLADEVGLGKTIEAGLILKELLTRGMAQRFLVICPASLRDQWVEELAEKFDLEARAIESGADDFSADNLVMSVQMARNNRERLYEGEFDVVIVDEAHKATGPATTQMLRRLASANYCLLLTATPVQNSLLDLYRLVEIIRPGTFGSESEFKTKFVGLDDKDPKDAQGLRNLIADSMVRTTRGQAGLDRVVRRVEAVAINQTPEELEDYRRLLEVLRAGGEQPGDFLRRQRWAQRLVLSPRSLAISLLRSGRYAGTSHEATVRKIAEAALGAGLSSRQKALVKLAERWTTDPDKGKVIVFTQQVEIAEDLIRVLEDHGLSTVGYFGGTTQRRSALREFKSSAQVLVATEAGAEGLNLQFANCVINYDLPWNPMKIEQRIGRVDRLTQVRDVHVANFFTPGTIEERIYQVLSEKLRMFELLFGQITMVLGEIDDKVGTSFESQISQAIFGDGDVSAAFDRVGQEAAAARARAEDQLGAQHELSEWLVDKSHQDGLSREGDDTLKPEDVAVSRGRQRQIVEFVQRYFDHVDAATRHQIDALVGDDPSEVPIFLTAQLPEHLQEGFGEVDELHLAFHPLGLDQHPDAELCAAGSEAFEDVVGALRAEGSIVADLPELDLDDCVPLLDGAPGMTFQRLEVLGPDRWMVRGLWLHKMGGQSGLIEVEEYGEPEVDAFLGDGPRRQLTAGEESVHTLDQESFVTELATIARESAAERADEVAELSYQSAKRRYDEQLGGRMDQIRELERELKERPSWDQFDLHNRLGNLRSLVDGMPEPERVPLNSYLELLGAEFVGGSEVWIREHWGTAGGHDVTIDVLYSAAEERVVGAWGVDDEPVATVAACDAKHVIDLSALRSCPTCATTHCGVCVEPEYRACVACHRPVCSACFSPGGLCRSCMHPVRDPELDYQGLLGFVVGDAQTLLVGPTSALLDGEPVSGVHTTHQLVSEAAVAHGLMPDASLRLDPSGWDPAETSALLLLADETEPRLMVDDAPDGAVAVEALSVLGFAAAEPLADSSSPWLEVVERLRAEHVWEDEGLVVRRVGQRTYLRLDDGGVVFEVESLTPNGRSKLSPSDPDWTAADLDPSSALGVVATAEVGESVVELSRVYGSYEVRVVRVGHDDIDLFVGSHPAAERREEYALAGLRARFGPGVGLRLGWSSREECPEASSSPFAELRDRTVIPIDLGASAQGVAEVEAAQLAEPPSPVALEAPTEVRSDLYGWARSLDRDCDDRLFGLSRWYKVEETWAGDGVARVSYRVEGGAPSCRPDEADGQDFRVDRSGHLLPATATTSCPVCDVHSCGDCDSELWNQRCPECHKPACGTCRSDGDEFEDSNGPVDTCATCGEALCPRCSRDLKAVGCALCAEPLCGAHADTGVCVGCSSLAPASDAVRSNLPPVLAPTGHVVLVGNSHHRRTVVVAGGVRNEVAVVDDEGEIVSWCRGHEMGDADYRAVLALSMFGAVADVEFKDHGPVGRDEGVLASRLTTEVAGQWGDQTDLLPLAAEGDVSPASTWVATVLGPDAELPALVPGLDDKVWDVVDDGAPEGAVAAVVTRHTVESAVVDGDGLGLVTESDQRSTRVAVSFGEFTEDGVRSGISGAWSFSVQRVGVAALLSVTGPDLPGSEFLLTETGTQRLDVEQMEGMRVALGVRVGRLAPGQTGAASLVEGVEGLRLVRREVEDSFIIDPATAITGDEADLLQVDVSVEPAELPAATGFRVGPGVVSLLLGQDEPVVPVGIQHDVTEVWAGESERELHYSVVGSSTPEPPMLDAPRTRSWDFTIDRSGHLVGPERIQSCPVCRSGGCSECVDGAALGACETCGQDACGTCRAARAAGVAGAGLALPECVGCGSGLCPDCSRSSRAAACDLCRRALCGNCGESGLCPACAQLAPVADSEVPQVLRAAGHDVVSATWRGETVYSVVGGCRSEVAVARGGELVSWADYSGLTPEEWRLVLASSTVGPVGGLDVTKVAVPEVAVAKEQMLHQQASPFVRLVRPDGTGVIAEWLFDKPGSAGVEVLVAALPTLPIDVEHLPPTARPAAMQRARGSAGKALVQVSAVAEQTWVAAEGIVTAKWNPDSVTTSVASYAPADRGVVPGAAATLADSVEIATAPNGSAARLTFGPVELLRLEGQGGENWFRIDGSYVDPRRVALGQHLVGRNVVADVVASTLPSEVVPLSIRNAELISRSMALAPHYNAAEVSARTDLQPILEGLGVAVPSELLAVRPPWAGSVRAGAQAPEEEIKVAIGVNVIEEWRLDGSEFDLRYSVPPGARQATELAFDTEQQSSEFTVDRNFHMAALPATCSYCSTLVCAKCEDRIRSCFVCGALACGACSSTVEGLTKCPACASLTEVGGLQKFRRVGRKGRLLQGADSQHEVEVEIAGDGAISVEVAVGGLVTERALPPEYGPWIG